MVWICTSATARLNRAHDQLLRYPCLSSIEHTHATLATADGRLSVATIRMCPTLRVSETAIRNEARRCLREVDSLILENVRSDQDTKEDADKNVDIVIHGCIPDY